MQSMKMPRSRVRVFAIGLLASCAAVGYLGCSSAPQYEGGGRNIETATISGDSTSTTKDAGGKDTSVPDTSVADTGFNNPG